MRADSLEYLQMLVEMAGEDELKKVSSNLTAEDRRVAWKSMCGMTTKVDRMLRKHLGTPHPLLNLGWPKAMEQVTEKVFPSLYSRSFKQGKEPNKIRGLLKEYKETSTQSGKSYESGTLRVMKERGLPLTLEKWMSMNYGHGVTLDDLGPELRAQIPKGLLGNEEEDVG